MKIIYAAKETLKGEGAIYRLEEDICKLSV